MSFSAILVDDEPLAVEGLRRFCDRDGRVRVVGDAADGEAALKLAAAAMPDAVFLDIGMPGLNGLQVAAGLAALPVPPLVAFVTAFDHYATQAFDLAIVDYVLKPIEPSRLDRAIHRIASMIQPDATTEPSEPDFWVPSRGGMVRVATSSVDRIDAERDYVRILAEGRSYLLRASLSAIEERLDRRRFVRVHRSTIIRIDSIVGLDHLGNGAWTAVGTDGAAIRIGRRHLAEVRSRLGIGS